MIKRLLKRLLRGKYHGLNQLDKQMEAYLDYDGGYFVELGANDGVSQSNTLYSAIPALARLVGRTGTTTDPQCWCQPFGQQPIDCAACVSFEYDREFVRIAYSNLMSTPMGVSTDIAVPCRVYVPSACSVSRSGAYVFEYGAVARTLNDLLKESGAPAVVDFLSLDVEGAELEVLLWGGPCCLPVQVHSRGVPRFQPDGRVLAFCELRLRQKSVAHDDLFRSGTSDA